MAANSRLTVCVNATLPCLQVGYRFQPLQPSISERNPLGISCPSTLPCETKNCFNRLPVATHLHGVLFESTSSANSRNVCFGLKSVDPLFSFLPSHFYSLFYLSFSISPLIFFSSRFVEKGTSKISIVLSQTTHSLHAYLFLSRSIPHARNSTPYKASKLLDH